MLIEIQSLSSLIIGKALRSLRFRAAFLFFKANSTLFLLLRSQALDKGPMRDPSLCCAWTISSIVEVKKKLNFLIKVLTTAISAVICQEVLQIITIDESFVLGVQRSKGIV